MRSIGLVDTEMYGGYELDALGDPPRDGGRGDPAARRQPAGWGRGKKTTAYDLASLLRAVWLASGGRGPLRARQPGFTVADARYLLYLLAQVRDPGKLGRVVGRRPGVRVLHKAGWIDVARHDNGIVVWPGGAIVATVMTYRPAGAGRRFGRARGTGRRRERFDAHSRLSAAAENERDARERASLCRVRTAPSERAALRELVTGPREAMDREPVSTS